MNTSPFAMHLSAPSRRALSTSIASAALTLICLIATVATTNGAAYHYSQPPSFTVGEGFTLAPIPNGASGTSWSITPALPSGLSIDPVTGKISGVPTAASAAKNYTVTATKAGQPVTVPFQMGPIKLPAPPAALQYRNDAYEVVSGMIFVKGDAVTTLAPLHTGGNIVQWSISPALPHGLSLVTGQPGLAGNGAISGTPPNASPAANYTVTARNAAGSTSAVLKIEVRDRATPVTGLTYSDNPANYKVGTQITPNKPSLATGVPSGFTVTPPLPAGLGLSSSSGEIHGTPSTAQAAKTYVITAGGWGTAGASVQLTIKIHN